VKFAGAILAGVTAFHEQQLSMWQHVLDSDGNIHSQEQRNRARDEIAKHRDFLRCLKLCATDDADQPMVLHAKRRSHYLVYGPARVQAESPLQDNDLVTLYRSIDDGSWFVRPPAEFEDGRFVSADPSEPEDPAALDPEEEVQVRLIVEGLDDRHRTMTREQLHCISATRLLSITYQSDPDDEDWWGDWYVKAVSHLNSSDPSYPPTLTLRLT
jgi:hypothetical protein